MTTTNLTSEEKEACREQAGEHLIAVLKGERSPYEGEERVYRILSDLVTTRNNFAHEAKNAKEQIDRALPYVYGEAASFNSLGILQHSGVRIDQYAMLFAKQVEYAKLELIDFYYQQAEAERDDRPNLDDLELARHIADQGDEAGFDAETVAAAQERVAREES